MEKLWIAGAVQEEKGIGGPVGVEIKEKGDTTAGKEEEAETEQTGEEAEGTAETSQAETEEETAGTETETEGEAETQGKRSGVS